MIPEISSYDVAIVGGGPVGLFLGCLLQKANINCVILEKRAEAVRHSRSIGIHPVSLECLAPLGLADSFLKEGIKVKKGLAFIDSSHLGTLSFDSCPPPYRFILTLPQFKTEVLLAKKLQALKATALWRDTSVTKLHHRDDQVEVELKGGGQSKTIAANYVIGCDGKDSFVRRSASIPFTETTYDDTYIMGDFSDNTDLGTNAAIYLCGNGLIESFPLPANVRRWVVKTDQYVPEVSRAEIELKIRERINLDLSDTHNTMLSSFGVQKGLAQTMAKERIILAGDAAHLISPIGGQGMNLGWLDAVDLVDGLKQILINNKEPDKILQSYSKRRLAIAKKVIRRAEFNMALGRKTKNSWIKKAILWPLLRKPLSPLMARLFTMRGLQTLPF